MHYPALLAVLATLTIAAAADIKFDEGDESKVVLASFGDASTTVNVLYKGPPTEDVTVSRSPLFTVGSISSEGIPSGYTNYSIELNFDKTVGSDTYSVTIGDESTTGNVIVAGFVILKDGVIVSGDDGAGVTVGEGSVYEYDVKAVGPDGRSVDISGTTLSPREMSGPYMKEVDMGRTSISSEKFLLAIAPKRVGTGSFMINFDAPAIEYAGESFETVLNVKQEVEGEPACVAIAGSYDMSDGYVRVPMFNLLTPPRTSPVSEVKISVGSESAVWDGSKSELTLPDQVAVFDISAAGTARITCDGKDAVVQGGDDVVIVGTPDEKDLATGLIATLPDSDGKGTVTLEITVVDSDPDVLSRDAGQAILDMLMSVTGGTNAVITAVTRGSAILDVGLLIDREVAEEGSENLEKCFETCECQKNLGYDCDKLALGSLSVNNAEAANISASGSGLATWTIVLVAAVGACALILMIVLGLWAVYRRSAEQSESDYSSSGPLGVPDPSDLLYEQSIVRDIYGRGDFPDGGPSQAVAEQRAREAALREEFPRPPSSSGVSRGTGTDDASSTYSV